MGGFKKYFLIIFLPIFAFLISNESLYSMDNNASLFLEDSEDDSIYYDCIDDDVAEIENSKTYKIITFICMPLHLMGKGLQIVNDKIEEKIGPAYDRLNKKIANSRIITKFCDWILRKSDELIKSCPHIFNAPIYHSQQSIVCMNPSKPFAIFCSFLLIGTHFSPAILASVQKTSPINQEEEILKQEQANHPTAKEDFQTCNDVENGKQFCCHISDEYATECCLFGKTQEQKDPTKCMSFIAITGEPKIDDLCKSNYTIDPNKIRLELAQIIKTVDKFYSELHEFLDHHQENPECLLDFSYDIKGKHFIKTQNCMPEFEKLQKIILNKFNFKNDSLRPKTIGYVRASRSCYLTTSEDGDEEVLIFTKYFFNELLNMKEPIAALVGVSGHEIAHAIQHQSLTKKTNNPELEADILSVLATETACYFSDPQPPSAFDKEFAVWLNDLHPDDAVRKEVIITTLNKYLVAKQILLEEDKQKSSIEEVD